MLALANRKMTYDAWLCTEGAVMIDIIHAVALRFFFDIDVIVLSVVVKYSSLRRVEMEYSKR